MAECALAGSAGPAFAATDAREVALSYLDANAGKFGVTSEDFADTFFTSYRGLDVLAEHQPYSRLVDCTTLQTVNPGQTAITPRPFPVEALGTLSVDTRGVFTFAWQTEAASAGSCREIVATADSGRQYRAYYRFT